jgi:hypothetical protein
MKTINDLKDELSVAFGPLISNIGDTEINLIISFIITSFAYDFPEVSARAYKLDSTTTNLKIYLESIHPEFLEMQFMFPIRKLNTVITDFYNSVFTRGDTTYLTVGYVELDELYSIQLANQYIEKMSTYYVPKKPLILNDMTGEYVNINKDTVIMYLQERILDINAIKEYVYSVLRIYTYYKFNDMLVNRQFSNLMDINQKVFDLIYSQVQGDLSGGDLEQVTSVSLSGLSVSFSDKLGGYAGTLSSLANSFNNPTFIEQMNKARDLYYNKFKRKKNIFYNYIF